VGSYSSAYHYGADFVELDIQITKDDHLVTSHDPCLKDTTNIENYEFMYASRKANYTFMPYTNIYNDDYLIKDFTLSELKMLRRKMRYASRNQQFNSEFTIQTLEETIELLLELNADFPRKDIDMKVGLYVETKMYNFYKDTYDKDIAVMVYETLKKYDLETIEKANKKLPIIIECFEKEALIKFAELSDLPLVYLMFWDNPNVSYDLKEITEYAHGVGPQEEWIFLYKNETWNTTNDSKFIEEAHNLGLAVHPYTLKDDMLQWTDSPMKEHILFMNKKVDGIFTEFPHMSHNAFTYFESKNSFP
jgi:glycerophosphoryl diester phosphodiesterase